MATEPQKKRQTNKVYFTHETEEAIIKYNKSNNLEEREQLFREKIHAPLDKLAENVINRFKFPYMEGTFDEVKSQVVSFLVINLHKFTEDKGKAFSYFSVIAKNYLILHNNWEFNLDRIFKKKRDREIAAAIVKLIERIDNIDNFNKKALYLMVREMTNYKTAHITKVINKMRPQILKMLGEFRRYGHLSDPTTYFRAQINSFIMKMVQLIRTPEDAAVIGPIVQGFLEVNVKNDEHLVRVAQIAQRIVSVGVKSNVSLEGLLSESEKEALLKDITTEIQDLQEDVKDLDDVFAENK